MENKAENRDHVGKDLVVAKKALHDQNMILNSPNWQVPKR